MEPFPCESRASSNGLIMRPIDISRAFHARTCTSLRADRNPSFENIFIRDCRENFASFPTTTGREETRTPEACMLRSNVISQSQFRIPYGATCEHISRTILSTRSVANSWICRETKRHEHNDIVALHLPATRNATLQPDCLRGCPCSQIFTVTWYAIMFENHLQKYQLHFSSSTEFPNSPASYIIPLPLQLFRPAIRSEETTPELAISFFYFRKKFLFIDCFIIFLQSTVHRD